ncbi:hypothetical protein AB833_29035 [Chromatiales bacterium (ex Bugula neritina AB1)]|nr:hypothetical protein AB833_29035 [Chromatiales bacterium (ex Bugula neritina AB1)]
MFEPTYFNLLREHNIPVFSEPDEMATTFKRLMDEGDLEGAMRSFVDAWAKQQGTWNKLPETMKTSMRSTAHRLYFEWDQIYGKTPSLEDLSDIDVPMLLVKGKNTIGAMDAVCGIMVSGLVNIDYLEVDQAGHMCPFTHIDSFAPKMLDFLKRNG